MSKPKTYTSRRRKTVRNLVLILLSIPLVYLLLGCPPLTAEARFRRAEKANLVGPAAILGIEKIEGRQYDRLVVAETADAVILHGFRRDLDDYDTFVYREKAGDVTVLGAPTKDIFWDLDEEAALGIVVFDEFPGAVRAELDFSLSAVVNDRLFEKDYSLSSTRRNEGYFLFRYSTSKSTIIGPEGYALKTFMEICGNYGDSHIDVAVPVTVRFYDESGSLIAARSLTVRSQAVEAHLERGEFTE